MMEITLPYYPTLRTLNSRTAAIASASSTAQVREDAAMLWRQDMQRKDDPQRLEMPLECAVHASVTFVLPDKRRRDLDNLVALVKPLLDGAVDAGIMVDDSQVDSMELTKRLRIGDEPAGCIRMTLRVRYW